MIELIPWNESGKAVIEDNTMKKCGCGIVTNMRLRLPYTNRLIVVCNQCLKDIKDSL